MVPWKIINMRKTLPFDFTNGLYNVVIFLDLNPDES